MNDSLGDRIKRSMCYSQMRTQSLKSVATKYIVLERSYEYNDETYDASEGGEPKVVFDTKVAAEKEAKRLNDDTWRTHEYLYEYHDRYYDAIHKHGMSIKDAASVLGSLNIFYVMPVEAR